MNIKKGAYMYVYNDSKERQELIKRLVEKIKQGANTNDIDPEINNFIEGLPWEAETRELYKDIEQVGKPLEERFYSVMETLKEDYKNGIYKDIYIILKYKNGVINEN